MLKRLFLLLIGASKLLNSYAQVLDPTFQLRELRTPLRPWVISSDRLRAVRQPDGRIIVGGSFDFVNGTEVPRLVRLLPNGTLDPSFDAGAGADGPITALLLQPDGKLLVAGQIKAYDRVPTSSVIRLLPNGRLDPTFAAPFFRAPTCLALQPNGSVLVGYAGSSNSPSNAGLTRLFPNGQIDVTFQAANLPGGSNQIRAVLVQPDGKIVVGGSSLNFRPQGGCLDRLLPDGTPDPNFLFTGPAVGISCVVQQPDGKLVAGGYFNYQLPNQVQLRGLLRVHPDGRPDTTFTPPVGTSTVSVLALALEPGGHIIAGGAVWGGQTGFLRRYSTTGQPDSAFASGAALDAAIHSIVVDGANGYLVSGFFHTFAGQPYTGLIQLLPGGTPDTAFRPLLETRGLIGKAQLQPSGAVLGTGAFTRVDGVPIRAGQWRFTASGALDTTFNSAVSGYLLDTDTNGDFFIGRQPTTTNNMGAVDRYFADGTPDTSFRNPAWGRFFPQGVVTLNGGDRIVYGVPPSNLPAAPGIYRLPAGGGTTPVYAVGDRTLAVLRQPDDNLICLDNNQILTRRFAADGRLDSTFQVPLSNFSFTTVGQTLLMQPTTGQVVLGGRYFDATGHQLPQSINRLTVRGALDTTFRVQGNYWLRTIQADGKLLVTTLPDSSNTTLRRLLPDGGEDVSFTPVAIPQGYVDGYLEGVCPYPDGRLLLYGSFRSVAGQRRIGLARLTTAPLGLPTPATTVNTLTLYPNPAHHKVRVEIAPTPDHQSAQIIDALGRVVHTSAFAPHTAHLELDLPDLTPGIYTVRVGLRARRLVVE